jgi:hypothetical protein
MFKSRVKGQGSGVSQGLRFSPTEEGGECSERGCALDARRRERLICGSSGGSAGFARIGGGSGNGRGGGGGADRGVLADPVEAPSSSDGGGVDALPGGDERAGNAVSRSVSLSRGPGKTSNGVLKKQRGVT